MSHRQNPCLSTGCVGIVQKNLVPCKPVSGLVSLRAAPCPRRKTLGTRPCATPKIALWRTKTLTDLTAHNDSPLYLSSLHTAPPITPAYYPDQTNTTSPTSRHRPYDGARLPPSCPYRPPITSDLVDDGYPVSCLGALDILRRNWFLACSHLPHHGPRATYAPIHSADVSIPYTATRIPSDTHDCALLWILPPD